MKFNIQSLLKDKNVLYVTLFIAITNMFAYLMFRQFDAVIFFVIVSVLASYFSKNMIIIMLAAILSTNFAISVKVIGRVKEGMTNKEDDKIKMPKSEDSKKKKDVKNIPKPIEGKDKNSKKQGFTQQLRPARLNAADADGDEQDDFDSQPQVDYASTLESAYDNLDKLLSSDAINNMSEDTHRLAEKQQMLMGNINKLQPMMEKAGSLLEGLNMDKMTNMLDGLGSKLTSLTGTAAGAGAGAGSSTNAMGPIGATEKKYMKKTQ
jgi:hypothetical protein